MKRAPKATEVREIVAFLAARYNVDPDHLRLGARSAAPSLVRQLACCRLSELGYGASSIAAALRGVAAARRYSRGAVEHAIKHDGVRATYAEIDWSTLCQG